jgi:hypothetical protein
MKTLCSYCLNPAEAYIYKDSGVDPGKFLCAKHVRQSAALKRNIVALSHQKPVKHG